MKSRFILPLLFMAGLCFAQEEPAELTNDATANEQSDVKDSFTEKYRALVQSAIKANIASNTATSTEYWANSRDFCFSTKPEQPDAKKAAAIADTPGLDRADPPRGVSPTLPYFEADTEKGKEQIKKLHEMMAKMEGKSEYTETDVVEMMDAALPFMRTVEAAAINRGPKMTVPAHSYVTVATHPYCLQVDVPAVGNAAVNRVHRAVGTNRPVGFYPSAILIPKEAQEIYAALLAYSPTHQSDQRIVQTLLWGIRGADLHPPFVNPNGDQIRVLNAALPDGAKKFAAFIDLAQHPKQNSKQEESSDGLLSMDTMKGDLLRHHLDSVVIKHGNANPYNPDDVDAILNRLSDPSPIPVFESQPTDQTVALNSTVTFSAKIKGSNLKYQWQFNGKDVPDATEADLSFKAAPDKIGIYQLIVSNDAAIVKSDRVRFRLAKNGSVRVVQRPTATTIPGKKTPNSRPRVIPSDDSFPADDNGLVVDDRGKLTPDDNDATVDDKKDTTTPQPPRVADDSSEQGPTLLAPNVTGEGTQTGLSTGEATIKNAGNSDYQFDSTKWNTATREPSQPSPFVYANLQAPQVSDASNKQATEELNGFGAWFKKQMEKGLFRGLLINEYYPRLDTAWVSEPMKMLLRTVPGLGSALSLYEVSTGYDAFDGHKLNLIERVAAGLGTVPGLGGFVAGAGKNLAPVAARLLGLLPSEARAIRPLTRAAIDSIEASQYLRATDGIKFTETTKKYLKTNVNLAKALTTFAPEDFLKAGAKAVWDWKLSGPVRKSIDDRVLTVLKEALEH